MNVDAVSSAVRSAALSAGPVAGRPPGNKSGGPPYPVEVRGICKTFGHTVALHQVSLVGRAGSVHAITGENGAGKSTLMKLLAGVHLPDAGERLINGQPVQLHSPAAARAAGISTVFQELTVLPNLTVAENLLLGREPTRLGWLSRSRMLTEAQAVLARIGITLDVRRAGGSLSIGEQQLVEIAKGVSTDASVFIFDEPTAPLNRAEVHKLESLIRALKAQGKLVFYISHRLDEIFRLCDAVTVLKDGQWVATEPTAALTPDRLDRADGGPAAAGAVSAALCADGRARCNAGQRRPRRAQPHPPARRRQCPPAAAAR